MTSRLRIGQRVWVASDKGRAYGRVASFLPEFLGGPKGFNVLLEGKQRVVCCLEELEGSQWGFARDNEVS